MDNHRFVFESAIPGGKGSKHTCPGCNKRREFTRYLDAETGEFLPDHVGICNNSGKCGYHYTPKQFFRENPDYLKNNTFTRSDTVLHRNYIVPRPVSYIPGSYMTASLESSHENNFVKYLCDLFPPDVVAGLIDRYKIGTATKPWPGSVIFWQIDNQGNVRTGKVMLYDSATGKRVKEPFNHFQWAHALMKKPGKINDFNLQQCFFGEHLINDADRIAVVESEKTAIIASVYAPEFTWIATGGKGNLSKEKCKVLHGKNVYLFPDKGCYQDWKERGGELADFMTLKVSNFLENLSEKSEGYDLGDYFPEFRFTFATR